MLAALLGLGCATGPEARPAEPSGPRPRATAQRVMDVCWPAPGAPGVVQLQLIAEQGAVKDVLFETRDGATNADARCLRAVAFAFPWEKGAVPSTLSLKAPAKAPSGWDVLEHVRLLTAGVFPASRGLGDPAPLVAACLARGGWRAGVQVRLEASPVRAALVQDVEERAPLTESERCVLAVLGASLYPGTRTFQFSFAEGAAPKAAPHEEVHWYFPPEVKGSVPEQLAFDGTRELVAPLKQKVAACWVAALSRRAGLLGGRSWQFITRPSGEVRHAEVTSHQSDAQEEASDYLLDRCVAKALYTARSSPSARGLVGTYSWVFAAQ